MQGFCFSNKFKVAGMVKQRIQLFDIARGLAIFMVISAHTLTIFKGTSISNFLFLGNLAVFFVVSGYFYRPKSLMQIVKTGVNTLLIPYFIAVIGYLLIRGFIGVVFLHHEFITTAKWLSLIYANGVLATTPTGYELTAQIGAIWFLPTMFIANIIFQLIMRLSKRWEQRLVILVMFILGVGLAHFGLWPWSFQTALQVQVFYMFGYELAQYVKQHQTLIFTKWWVGWSSFTVWLVSSWFTWYGLNQGRAEHIVLATIAAAASAIAILSFSYFIERHWVWLTKFLAYAGEFSLIILIIHTIDLNLTDMYLQQFMDRQAPGTRLMMYISLTILRIGYATGLTWIILKFRLLRKWLVQRNFPITK